MAGTTMMRMKTTTGNVMKLSSKTIFPTSRRKLTRKGRSASHHHRPCAYFCEIPTFPLVLWIELSDLSRFSRSSVRRMVSPVALPREKRADEKSPLTLISLFSRYIYRSDTNISSTEFTSKLASDGCRYYYRLYRCKQLEWRWMRLDVILSAKQIT